VSDELVIFGTTGGNLWTYDRDNEKRWGKFQDNGKDYQNNPVTSVDIHPLRPEYVIIGYQRG